jgi:hypothetical protein
VDERRIACETGVFRHRGIEKSASLVVRAELELRNLPTRSARDNECQRVGQADRSILTAVVNLSLDRHEGPAGRQSAHRVSSHLIVERRDRPAARIFVP